MYSHTHTTSSPSVYRVSIPESTHEGDHERHQVPMFPSILLTLPLSLFFPQYRFSLFIFLVPFSLVPLELNALPSLSYIRENVTLIDRSGIYC